MSTILTILYAFYFILVGVDGNAPQFLSMVGQEKQFLYWFLVLLLIAALWESPVAEPLAKSLCFLIVIGFLIHNHNGLTIGANAKAILPGL